MFTLAVFIFILGLLVLSHEFGHFVAARRSGMKVYEFGFGFPPRCCGVQVLKKIDERSSNPARKFRFVWGGKSVEDLPDIEGYRADTLYSFNYLPLGGFVRIKGEEGENTDSDSFMAKPFGSKVLVLVAGVSMNVLLAAVIFSIGFMIGLPQQLDGIDESAIVKDRQLQVMQAFPNMPAQSADIKAGDYIVKLDSLDNPRLTQMQDYVDTNRDSEITVTIRRIDEIMEKKITPQVYEQTGRGGLGVSIAEVGTVKYVWYKAIYKGIAVTWLYLKAICVAFYNLFVGLFTGNGAAEAVSGPVGIAVLSGQIAKLGFAYLLNFTAILSLNLAILNILPIPALDGGRLVFLTIGKIFRKKVPLKYEQVAHTAGFLALMLLVVVVTVRDIGKFSESFGKILDKVF